MSRRSDPAGLFFAKLKNVVPNDNKKDVSELPQEVKDNLKIHYMNCVDDALAIALVHPKA